MKKKELVDWSTSTFPSTLLQQDAWKCVGSMERDKRKNNHHLLNLDINGLVPNKVIPRLTSG